MQKAVDQAHKPYDATQNCPYWRFPAVARGIKYQGKFSNAAHSSKDGSVAPQGSASHV